jgi:hypothetical protein
MKYLCIVLLVLATVACKKHTQPESDYPFVYLSQCISQTYSGERVELCFNAVNDSRCPANAACISEGAAIASFLFRKNGTSHSLVLSTTTLNIPYGKDTTVDGYKIEFINLHPYPQKIEKPTPSHKLNAEVKITKL